MRERREPDDPREEPCQDGFEMTDGEAGENRARRREATRTDDYYNVGD